MGNAFDFGVERLIGGGNPKSTDKSVCATDAGVRETGADAGPDGQALAMVERLKRRAREAQKRAARIEREGVEGAAPREERKTEAFERQSPPFAQNAKDGAPSSSMWWCGIVGEAAPTSGNCKNTTPGKHKNTTAEGRGDILSGDVWVPDE